MPIIAKDGGSNFETAPEGAHQAVCVDVVDKGMVETSWGEKHKVQIRWVLDSKDSEGRGFMVMSTYTLSLNERAKLRKDLESWRGRDFTSMELDGFDLENLIGVNCQVNIVHTAGDGGKTWANIKAIMPLGKGMAKLPVPSDYRRVCDREESPPEQRDLISEGLGDVNVDEVPF